MDAVWIGRSGTKHGPYPARQVIDAYANGKLQPGDLLWWQGLEGWVALNAGIEKLCSALGVPAPRIAEPAPPTSTAAGVDARAAAATLAGAAGHKAAEPPAERQGAEFVQANTAGAAVRPDLVKVDPYRAPGAAVADPSDGTQPLAYAGFWVRFGAFVLDTLVIAFAGFLLGSAIGLALIAGGEHSAALVVASQLGGLVVGWLYYALFESGGARATPGKMAFRLQVLQAESGERLSFLRATGRFAGKFLSGLLLGIGYLIQPFTTRKQALHDLISGATVVETGPYSRVLLWVCLFVAFVPLFFGLLGVGFLLFGLAGPLMRLIS